MGFNSGFKGLINVFVVLLGFVYKYLYYTCINLEILIFRAQQIELKRGFIYSLRCKNKTFLFVFQSLLPFLSHF